MEGFLPGRRQAKAAQPLTASGTDQVICHPRRPRCNTHPAYSRLMRHILAHPDIWSKECHHVGSPRKWCGTGFQPSAIPTAKTPIKHPRQHLMEPAISFNFRRFPPYIDTLPTVSMPSRGGVLCGFRPCLHHFNMPHPVWCFEQKLAQPSNARIVSCKKQPY